MILTPTQLTNAVAVLQDLVDQGQQLETILQAHPNLTPNRLYEYLKANGQLNLALIKPVHVRAIGALLSHLVDRVATLP